MNDDSLDKPMMTALDSNLPTESDIVDGKKTLNSRLQSTDAEVPKDECLSEHISDCESAPAVQVTPVMDCSKLCSNVLKSQKLSIKTVFKDAVKSQVIVDICSMSNGSEADSIKMDGNCEISLDNSNDDAQVPSSSSVTGNASPSSMPVTSTAIVTTAKVELAMIADITSSTNTDTTISGSPSAVSLNWPMSYVHS